MAKLERFQPPQGWQDSVQKWESHLQARRLSPETIRTRRQALVKFSLESASLEPSDVTLTELESWIAQLKIEPATAYSYRAGLRSFFGFCAETGIIPNDPAEKLPRIHRPDTIPTPCPEHAIIEALSHCGQRESIMIRLAAEHGLRCGEIARANGSDLAETTDGYVLIIKGKGGRQRVVYLDRDETELISAYQSAGANPLFPGKHNGHLSPRWVGTLIKRLLPGAWTAHKCRTCFATVAYRTQRDLLTLQGLMGHKSSDTTRMYILLDDAPARQMSRGALIRA